MRPHARTNLLAVPGVGECNCRLPQEMAHFVDCVRHDREPLVTGEDGKVVTEIIFAA